MTRIIVALLALSALPLAVAAQTAPGVAPGQVPLEIRQEEGERASRLGRPVVLPESQSEEAVREAARAAETLARAQRDRKALREHAAQTSRRPDLGYDVWSGIQQKNLMRVLRR